MAKSEVGLFGPREVLRTFFSANSTEYTSLNRSRLVRKNQQGTNEDEGWL